MGDETDMPAGIKVDSDQFVDEQQLVARLVHQLRHEDTDMEYQMINLVRNFFGQGGPHRLKYTLEPIFFACAGLLPRIKKRETPGTISLKKVFQFMHKTNSALVSNSPEAALSLWLTGAAAADKVDRDGTAGAFEPICYEFLTQALLTFEDEITETEKQY